MLTGAARVRRTAVTAQHSTEYGRRGAGPAKERRGARGGAGDAGAAAAGAALGAALRPHARGRGRGGGRHAGPHAGAAEHRLRRARQPARAVRPLLLLRRYVPYTTILLHSLNPNLAN